MRRMTSQKTIREMTPGRAKSGFTLIEILIVVIILGILAAIVIPNVSNASMESKENMLKENLRVLRAQIGVYRAQHGDVSPGYLNADPGSSPTEESFVGQMTLSTNIRGETAAANTPGYIYGPYFHGMPKNPMNKLDSVKILGNGEALPTEGDDNYGWIFQPESAAIFAANVGMDMSGVPFIKY